MSFEEYLLAAIDEAFNSIGEKCKETIYHHLEKKYKLNKNDIPDRIEDFLESIEGMFGLGAKVLEMRIMKNLYQKIEFPFPYLFNKESLDFVNYIKSVRNIFDAYSILILSNNREPNQLKRCVLNHI
jgi:hypothetical protein